MGFKDMKRDDHGHVISNDEVDGQKCKHQSGGNRPSPEQVEDQKYKKEMQDAQEQNAAMSEAFDDDYEEEFEDRNEKIAIDINEYFDNNQLNDLKRYCDKFDVDFDKAKLELAKYFDKMQKDGGFSQVDAAEAALEALKDDIVIGDLDNESQDEYKLEPGNNNTHKITKNGELVREINTTNKDDAKQEFEDFKKEVENNNPPTLPEGPDNPPIRDKELDQAMLNSRPRMGLYDSREIPNGSSFIETTGRYIAPDNGSKMTHDDINKALKMDLYNDKKLIALNSGVYGSRIASIDIPEGKQVTDAEWNSIKRFIDKAKAEGKTIDFGHGPYNTKDYDAEDILAMIKRKRK